MHARVGVSVGFGRPAAMAAAFYGDWTAIARRSRELVPSSSLAGAFSWTKASS